MIAFAWEQGAAQPTTLDFDMWYKLQFKDGLVYDFKAGALRAALPADRLLHTTARAFVEWAAPAELKSRIARFAACVKQFFLAGGSDFDPLTDEHDERHLKESDQVKTLREAIWDGLVYKIF